MFVKLSQKEDVEILPECRISGGAARCLMFYEWENTLGSDWLGTVDRIFDEFGVAPFEGIGNFGKNRTKGKYKRIRKRIDDFLLSDVDAAQADVRIESAPNYSDETFFPCDLRITWSVAVSGMRLGVVAIRDSLVDSCEEMVDRIEENVFRQIGTVYATAFDFPANYGPDYYLSAVGAVPSGVGSGANKEYVGRLTQWRDNTWHNGLRMKDGYLREVYPINFLLDKHLDVMFRGRPMSEFMTMHGDLASANYGTSLYRWDVHSNKLMDVRRALETSGIVLSSSSRPKLERSIITVGPHSR